MGVYIRYSYLDCLHRSLSLKILHKRLYLSSPAFCAFENKDLLLVSVEGFVWLAQQFSNLSDSWPGIQIYQSLIER